MQKSSDKKDSSSDVGDWTSRLSVISKGQKYARLTSGMADSTVSVESVEFADDERDEMSRRTHSSCNLSE